MSDPLRAAGLRRTPARKAVHGLVERLGRPVTHGDLSAALPDLDDITLYRTLATLVDAGLVHRVMGVDGAWRYSANPTSESGCPGNHAHFLCTTCRGMWCLRDQPMPRVEVPEGARVEGRNFLVFGACAACAAPALTAAPGPRPRASRSP